MIACGSCGTPLDWDAKECTVCGSVDFAEQFPVPPSLSPANQWMARLCRITIAWESEPAMATLRKLARSGHFPSSSREMLEEVRATSKLISANLAYGRSKEWVESHAENLDGGVVRVEVQMPSGEWKRVPFQSSPSRE